MRVALMHHSYGTPHGGDAEPHMRELAHALLGAGHDVLVVSSHPRPTERSDDGGIPVVHVRRLPEAPLRLRAFDGPITHIPNAIDQLRGFQVAHAFTPQDAWAAAYGPTGIAFTFVEAPTRETLSDRRLRLRFWEVAANPWNGLIAPGEEQRAAAWRWLAVEPEVIRPSDAEGHERVYRACWERATS